MIIDNRLVLQVKNKVLLEKLENHENTTCEVIQAKNGMNTLIMTQENKKISYHSRYNPAQEAATILKNQMQPKTKYVVLIGVGLGYIVHELIKNYPDVRFSIYEPNLDVMSSFLNHYNLSKLRAKKLDKVFSYPLELGNFDGFFDNLSEKEAQIVVSPIAETLYSVEIEKFKKALKDYMKSNKDTAITDLRFQMRWTINSIVNFTEVIQSPNFFEHIDLTKLTNKPALIVAAGPSLNDEIDNIRFIKEHGKAYIFAVGSAVNTLISNEIIPDALISYDPTPLNAKVVEKIKKLKLKIPLIFGSSIGYEVLREYPGNKIHFFTTQDSINRNMTGSQTHVVPDTPTVAAMALYIIGGVKMNPIMLVGQNLSITKERKYADGIDYINNNEVSEQTLKSYKPVISTTNEEIYTDDSYLGMKNALEAFIYKIGPGKVFNTTKNGLPIEGAPFITLDSLIKTHLQKNDVVYKDVFEKINSYNIKQALKNFEAYESQFDDLIMHFKKVVEIDKKIIEAYQSKVINNVQAYLIEFDKHFGKIEKNLFFLRTLAPITRAQYKKLVKDSEEVRIEKRPLQKIEKYLNTYSKYIRTMYAGIIEIQPAFAELKKSDLFKKEDSK